MKIFDILPVGEENAISAKALSAKLGLSVRECRARISKELQEGSFCLSSTHRPEHIVPADISDHLPAKKDVKNFCAFTVENFRAAVRVLEN